MQTFEEISCSCRDLITVSSACTKKPLEPSMIFLFLFSRFHQQSDFQDLAKRFEYEFITPKKRELVSDITASRRERI